MGRPHLRLPRPEPSIALGPNRRVTVGEPVGSGEAGTVFRAVLAQEHGLERAVAIKVFEGTAGEDREASFASIAAATRSSANLAHPNIVAIHELGVTGDGRPFVVQELVEGASLEALSAAYETEGLRVPLDLALFLGVEIAEALNAARIAKSPSGIRLGLLHGTLSARQVLLSVHGEVKVGEFAGPDAARAMSSVRSFGVIASRATTLAPELIAGEAATPRSDVFALGIILWQMLIGPRFPKGIDDARTVALAREGFVQSTVFDPQLPVPLRALLRRALDPVAQRRFPHAGALGYELRRLALEMGAGDGRVFLKHALRRLRDEDAVEDAITSEMDAEPIPVTIDSDIPPPPPSPPPPRLRIHPASGTVRRAARRPRDQGP